MSIFFIFAQFYVKMEGANKSGVEFFRTLKAWKRTFITREGNDVNTNFAGLKRKPKKNVFTYILEKRIESESHWHRVPCSFE